MEYEVKPGTQTDTRIRLKGKGVPSLRNKNVRGDHYVTFVVQVPTNLNEEAKECISEIAESIEKVGIPLTNFGKSFLKKRASNQAQL